MIRIVVFLFASTAWAGTDLLLPFGLPNEDLRDALADTPSAIEAPVPEWEAPLTEATTTQAPDAGRNVETKAGDVRPGWMTMSSSLLLYNSSTTLVQEVGLGSWIEEIGGTTRRHVVRGGASKDGRFAWAWEKIEAVSAPARPGAITVAAEKSRLLRYFGTDGQELWRNEFADATKDVEPAVLSANGERVLVIERIPDGWNVAHYDFVGNRLIDVRNAGPVELALLSPSGRYALVRWHPVNRPPIYEWFDTQQKIRRTLPRVEPGSAVLFIDDAGRVYAGTKLLFAS